MTITGCIRGAAGSPGELRGEFAAAPAGTVLANDAAGVYGSYTGSCTAPALPVANLQEVTPGEAELWTTVLGTTAQPYTIQVACDDDRQRPEPKPADPRDGQAPA